MYYSYLLGACVVTLCAILTAKALRAQPLPPGPRGRWPLLGMTFDMPTTVPWKHMANWAKEYGPLIHYRIGLQDFILISDGNIARDILDKRAASYSSRPPSEVGDLISLGMRSVLMPYGAHWRRVRKIFNNVLTSRKCDTYVSIQEGEAIASIQNLRQDPSSYVQEIHRYSLSVARSIAFGRRVPSIHDPYAIKTKKLMETFALAMTPGKYLFESMPILRKLPRALQPWLPELELARDYENEAALTNYREALAYSEKHPNLPSVARDMYHELGKTGDISELQAATTCMEVLGAGSDTTANSILFTIMAMATHPDVLRKAHEELDRVIGQNRMPVWTDEPNLPYVRAIIKEQQRWRCIAPMSFPHWIDKEDVYQGYRIPKNAVVRVNSWAIHMDEKRYSNPEVFEPERFIKHNLSASAYANSSDAKSRDHFAYGGGKRICVGIHLAERTLFSMTARLLHAFAIKPALDDKGMEIPIDVDDLVTGLITSPKDFPVRFEVRSDTISKVLDREASDCLKGVGESWATTLDE